jgi:hypothetical protein
VTDEGKAVVERRVSTLEGLIDSALNAKTTREMTTSTGYAQAAAIELKEYLQSRLDNSGFADHQSPAVQAAIDALAGTWESAEKVGLGTDPTSMHERVLDFKTDLERALAQVREALSSEL